MLTIFEQNEVNKVAQSYLDQILYAIRNKKIDRQSVRWNNRMRQYVYASFQSVVNASGRLYDSAQKIGTDSGVSVIIDSYVDKLINGQEPGEPVDVNQILRWMNDRDMVASVAGANNIANKINKFGSSIYIQHKGQNSGLFDEVNIDDLLEEMENNLMTNYANNVVALIDDSLAA